MLITTISQTKFDAEDNRAELNVLQEEMKSLKFNIISSQKFRL